MMKRTQSTHKIIHVAIRSSSTKKVNLLKPSRQICERKDLSKEITHSASIDHHRKQKRVKKGLHIQRYFIAISVIILIVLLIVLPVILLLSRKTRTSSIEVELRWNRTGLTIAGVTGVAGNSSDKFRYPTDIRLDYANNLYVVDQNNHRVQKFLFGNSIGETVAGTGQLGLSQNQLNTPIRINLDSNENMYISDTYNHRIQLWKKGSTTGITVAGVKNVSGATNYLLNGPYETTLHPTSNILYIADQSNHRIVSYSYGANISTTLLGGSPPGYTNTKLYYPTGLFFDELANSLVIANAAANNIVHFALGATNWTLHVGNGNGTQGSSAIEFNRPIGITFDVMNNMYVADRENHRIQFFFTNQTIGRTIAGITGVPSSNSNTLQWPLSVRLDSQLNLYVADTSSNRIQKFLRY